MITSIEEFVESIYSKSNSENIHVNSCFFVRELMLCGDEEINECLTKLEVDIDSSIKVLEKYITVSNTPNKWAPQILTIYEDFIEKNKNSTLFHLFIHCIQHCFLPVPFYKHGINLKALEDHYAPLDVNKLVNDIERFEQNKIKIPNEISYFVTNLHTAIQEGELLFDYQRRIDISEIYTHLSKLYQSNLIIKGENGTGVKNVVYDLVYKSLRGQLPGTISDVPLFELNFNEFLACSKTKGDFDIKLNILYDFLHNFPRVFLIIQDIETIVSGVGTFPFVDYFHKFFISNNITLIGTTTESAYNGIIKHTIKSHFNIYTLSPANLDEVTDICKLVIDELEDTYSVTYDHDITKAAFILSTKYNSDTKQPQATIDLLDEIGAAVFTQNISQPVDVIKLQDDMHYAIRNKEHYVEQANFQKALKFQQEQDVCLQELREKTKDKVKKRKKVTKEYLYEYYAKKYDIPITNLNDIIPDLTVLESSIKTEFISQQTPLNAVMSHLSRVKTGMQDENKPLGSFLFLGPTGSGKTLLCKLLAKYIFKKDNFIRLDMSEYKENHSTSRMLGAPPGYIGYGDSGELAKFIQKHPFSLILFDEIEKAHRDVYDLFLQLLEEGELTTASGETLNFKNCIIVFTSNIGSDLQGKTNIGFNSAENISETEVKKALGLHFRPEFLNRLDEITQFKPFEPEDIQDIVKIYITECIEKLKAKHNIKVNINDDVVQYIAKNGYDKQYGAKFLKRYFNNNIVIPISREILNKPKKKTIKIEILNNQISIK